MNQTVLYLGICALCTAFFITLGISLFLDHLHEKRHRHSSRLKNIV